MRKGTSHFIVDRSTEQAKARLKETIQSRAEETDKIMSNIDQAYKKTISAVDPTAFKAVASALKELVTIAKEGIEYVVQSANNSQLSEGRLFQQAAKELESELENNFLKAIYKERRDLHDLRSELTITGNKPTKAEEANPEPTPSSLPNKGRRSIKRTDTASTTTSGGRVKPSTSWFVSKNHHREATEQAAVETSSETSPPGEGWGRDFAPTKGPYTPRSDSVKAREQETSRVGRFDNLHPLMGDALQLGDDITREFREDMEAEDSSDSDEWRTDDDHQAKKHMHEQEKELQREARHQKALIGKKEKEIVLLKQENVHLKAQNNELTIARSHLQSILPKGQQGTTGGTPGGTPASVGGASVGSTAFPFSISRINSRLSSPDNASWLKSWLPKALQSHRGRLQKAIGRCVTDQQTCERRMLKLADDVEPGTEKKHLQIFVDSSKQHCGDYTRTIEFFDELAARAKKTKPAMVPLAEELAPSASGSSSVPLTAISVPPPPPATCGYKSGKPASSSGSPGSGPRSSWSHSSDNQNSWLGSSRDSVSHSEASAADAPRPAAPAITPPAVTPPAVAPPAATSPEVASSEISPPEAARSAVPPPDVAPPEVAPPAN
ncbi:hypothetical protein FZEAL_10650, partial [Fusarium zealandicum]